MTPFEIALAVRNRADPAESIQSFAMRTMAKERMADFGAALNLLIGWERAYEQVQELLDRLVVVATRDPGATLDVLIAAKRKIGYDHKLEAVLAHRWRCPHCKQFATLEKIELPIGDPKRLPLCTLCGEEGIAPVETEANLDVRDGGKSGLRPIP